MRDRIFCLLHCSNPEGLQCDIFVTHAWAEGVFEFVDKVLRAWPAGNKHRRDAGIRGGRGRRPARMFRYSSLRISAGRTLWGGDYRLWPTALPPCRCHFGGFANILPIELVIVCLLALAYSFTTSCFSGA